MVSMKKSAFPFLLSFGCLFFFLINSTAQTGSRKKINFDEDWKFHFGHAANPEKDFNYGIKNIFVKSGTAAGTAIDPKFNDSSWRSLNLPHDWAVELPFEKVDNFDVMAHGYKPVGGLFPATSIGWYRKHFTIAKADSGQRFQIQFDGIYRDAHIWVNGFFVGNNKSGYVGAAYDVTDYINFDKENVLVVRADATQYEGWFYEGAGIYRHVWLNQYNNLNIQHDGIFAYSTVSSKKATVTVETTIDNKNDSSSSGSVTVYLINRAGATVAKSAASSITLNAGETKATKQTISINNPSLWSLEDPYLYRLLVQVKMGESVVDSKTMRFGIRILGADISFLPELESKGIKFSDKAVEKDPILILKDHGINYIRLRIFNDPSADSGYSPKLGFCDLEHTLQMAKRVKAAGLKLLLDFHYSDYWADPGKQYKPAAWRNLSFPDLKQALYDFTKRVMQELKEQGTLPDMVQVGNEINHGIVWPDGSPDGLAQLINAGTAAVKSVEPATVMMLYVALGGQNHESVFFIDNMVKRGVHFDVIGESYYPKWHGTLDDLRDNLADLAQRYNKDVVVVEYSQLKEEVNKIAFEVPGGRGKGTFIWEPLSTWESVFERDGKSKDIILKFDNISKQFLAK